MSLPVDLPPGQMIGYPQYQPPGLSIRATFLATDGSRPQEIIIEWRDDPGRAMVAYVLDRVAEMASPGDVHVQALTPTPSGGLREVTLTPGGNEPAHPAGESTTQLPRPYCNARGPAHDNPDHGCTLYAGHEPVEPGGRRHRCRCGGIFGTDDEHPAVPGRREQARARERNPDR